MSSGQRGQRGQGVKRGQRGAGDFARRDGFLGGLVGLDSETRFCSEDTDGDLPLWGDD